MLTIAMSKLDKVDKYPYYDYISDNETIGMRELPYEFMVRDLGNGQKFVAIQDDGDVVKYKQICGCTNITLVRL